jgi:hypothetical protein
MVLVGIRERNHLEERGTGGKMKNILRKFCERACTGLIWLRTGTGGKLF